MIVAGIDPGLDGAIAIYDDRARELIEVYDLPTISESVSGRKKRRLNIPETASILRQHSPIDLVRLERVGAMPGQGVTSMFNFGRGYGNLEAIVQTIGIPISYVTPGTWKKAAGLVKAHKDAARGRALQDFPDAELGLKKHVGRADAILIARYGT